MLGTTLGVLLGAIPLAQAVGWDSLWTPHPQDVAEGPVSEYGGRSYLTLTSRYFMVLIPDSSVHDADVKGRFAAERLDNLYDFLKNRMGISPAVPIRAVLLPNQYGRSRTVIEQRAITTGDKGTSEFIVGSFFHELVHYFNLSIPGGDQDFWSGELFAQYHDDRLSSGNDHRKRFKDQLSARGDFLDWSRIEELERRYKNLWGEEPQFIMRMGVSVLYFLEDEFGEAPSKCFWQKHIDPKSRSPRESWETCFGLSQDRLRGRWITYYDLGDAIFGSKRKGTAVCVPN